MSSSLNPTARTFIPPSSTLINNMSVGSTNSPIVMHHKHSFPHIQNLQDELILLILSFVSDVPYEASTTTTESTLTHIFPLVSKSYYSLYSKSDILWQNALVRLVKQEPGLWGHGLKSFLQRYPLITNNNRRYDENMNQIPNSNSSNNNSNRNTHQYGDDSDDGGIQAYTLVNDAGRSMDHTLQTNNGYFSNINLNTQTENVNDQITTTTTKPPIFMELYRYILSNFIKFSSPLFYMPDHIQLGEEFGIHFFEPRYRLLIGEVMSPYPDSFKNGDPITPNNTEEGGMTDTDMENNNINIDGGFSYPTFIYANKSPLKKGTSVTIVQVRQCVIHHNQTADVFLMPISYARIEQVWVRPNSHNLYEARVIMMGEEEYHNEIEQSRRAATPATTWHGHEMNVESNNNNNVANVSEYVNAMLLQLMQTADEERRANNSEE